MNNFVYIVLKKYNDIYSYSTKKFREAENWKLFLLSLFYKPTLYYYYEFDSMINHLNENDSECISVYLSD